MENTTDNVEILLAEDNLEDAQLVLHSLKKNHLGNSVLHVVDGVEALDFIFAKGRFSQRDINQIPKIILLDLKMPKIGGLEVLRTIRSDELTRSIPVIVMTASREDNDRIESYELGVNAYIVKPVVFENFVKTVNELGMSWLTVNQTPK